MNFSQKYMSGNRAKSLFPEAYGEHFVEVEGRKNNQYQKKINT